MSILSPTAAAAEAVTAGTTLVDWTPLAAVAIAALTGVVAALGRAALTLVERHLARRFDLVLDDSTRAYLEACFAQALAYGSQRAHERVARDGATTDLRSAVLAEAAQYVIDSVPDAVARFGLDRAGIERRLRARLGDAQG